MNARYLILSMIVLAVAGCDNSLDRPIHYVVPDEFTGPFVIISNRDHPDLIVKYAYRYQLTVPSDGVIRTKNIDIIQRWHKTSAVYSSGSVLASPGDSSEQFHAAHTGTSDNRTYRSWYFVGPSAKFKEFFYGESSWDNENNWLESRGLSQ